MHLNSATNFPTCSPSCAGPARARCSPTPAHAERLKDLASIGGVRQNQLSGYGLVVGLDGTGDQTTQTPFTVQSIMSMLQQKGVSLPAGTQLQLKNVAAVMVTTSLPAFAQPGQTIDVTVSSMGNAKSLRGGTLLMTPLKGADGQVYAMAQGNVLVGGAGASRRRRVGAGEPAGGRPHLGRRHGRARGRLEPRRRQPGQAGTEHHRLRHRQPRGRGDQRQVRPRHRHRAGRPRDPRARALVERPARVLPRHPGEHGRQAGRSRRQGDPERAHRLDRDEPRRHAGHLRHLARQPDGDDRRRHPGQPAGAGFARRHRRDPDAAGRRQEGRRARSSC